MPLNPVEKSLAAGLLARISIPSEKGIAETYFARVKTKGYPYLEAEFSGEKYPGEAVSENWIVTVNSGVHLVSIQTRVENRFKVNGFRIRVMDSRHHVQGRRYQRVETEAYLRCIGNGSGFQEWVKPLNKRVDISPVGIRFVADCESPLGERIEVELFLPGRALEQVTFAGKVIRASLKENGRCEVSVEITEISDADREKIAAFCMAQQFLNMKSKAEALVSPLLSS